MEVCNINTSSMDVYKQENQKLAELILTNYIYNDFSIKVPKSKKHRNLEIIVSPRCNLGCKYCYLHRHRKEIFGEDCFNEDKTIQNLKLILQWLHKHDMNPNIEIFSGELLAQNIGYQVLETIYNHFKDLDEIYRPQEIVIPTNYTFLCNEEAVKRVEAIREKLMSIGIVLGLSASFDGKYMEQNRPYLHDLDIPLGGVRDDDYYERVFKYTKDTHGGLHPMVYSKGIKDWPKNFDWFQQMMEKYDIPWESIYLLHVRNEEWTLEDIQASNKFIEHLYAYAWEKVNHCPDLLVEWIIKGSGFNMLSQPFSSCGRGMTCGIQGQFTVRLSDLMLYPCHRTGYKDFYFGQFVPDEEEILRFENTNVELMLMTYSIDKRSFPLCAQCPINELCGGTCIGAQYEATANLLTPIPTVCCLSYASIITGMKCLKKYGAWPIMWDRLTNEKKQQFLYLEEMVNDSEN